MTIETLESGRLEMQRRLDGAKGQGERNKLGQFATPTELAVDIASYAGTLLPPASKVRFLDPAFGTGAFFSALVRAFPSSSIEKACGFEIDADIAQEASRLWSESLLRLSLGDFTKADASRIDYRANLVICNPPYVRHHHMSGEEKVRLRSLVEERTGIKLNGLAGLYCYFLCLAHAWMEENALAAWLIPSEFMDVNYGAGLKDYLIKHVTLLRIHRFDPGEVQFKDALVSSAVVWFRKAIPPTDHTVEFTYGGSLAVPKVRSLVTIDELDGAPKWTKFSLFAREKPRDDGMARLSDLFEIKRGLATGANHFFVLSAEKIAQRCIPNQFLQPVLPSPRFLTSDEILADESGNPILEKRLFLISCDRSQREVEARFPILWQYLENGRKQGISERYLCSHRIPWYSQECRPAPPFLCTYMGRNAPDGGAPFRFILNRSKATALNVYLLLYPRPALKDLLCQDPRLQTSIWSALSRIPSETLKGEGRVYGGGLHKIEPCELANAPADEILAVLPGSFHSLKKQSQLAFK